MPRSSRYGHGGELPDTVQRSCQEAQELFAEAYASAVQVHGEGDRAYRVAFTVLKTGGAAYLLWLAIQAIRFGSSLSVKKVDAAKGTPFANISNGFWVNLLNPKVIIFFMTFLPQFVTTGDPAVTHKLLFLGFFFIVIGMPVNTLVVLAADGLSSWLQRNRGVMRGLDYAFAGVFSIFAVKIFFTQAR